MTFQEAYDALWNEISTNLNTFLQGKGLPVVKKFVRAQELSQKDVTPALAVNHTRSAPSGEFSTVSVTKWESIFSLSLLLREERQKTFTKGFQYASAIYEFLDHKRLGEGIVFFRGFSFQNPESLLHTLVVCEVAVIH